MTWIFWALMLIAQQASATASSRTRNGRNLKAHALAAVFSNGVWIVNSFVAFDAWGKAKGDTLQVAMIAAFYTAFAVAGSVGMHHLMIVAEDKKDNARRSADL
jgi:hypothetical protein